MYEGGTVPIDVNFMAGGEAGQGVQSVGFILAKAFSRGGYHIFADQDLKHFLMR
jgi:2-oxoglutarate ferredoxin oxidoreductase subunit alpha